VDPDFVAKTAQIASVLEVSGHPKPGNVHRTHDFDDMVFEDFLISGVVIGDTMKKAAKRGLKYKGNPESFHKIKLGKLIKTAVIETNKWIANNTNLGIVMLLTPISAAAGMVGSLEDSNKDICGSNNSIGKGCSKGTDINNLRKNIGLIMDSTTPDDAVNLYDAINIADAGGMGERDELDVGSDAAKDELIEKGINMFDVLDISAEWDMLSYELTNKMPVTFETGFPVFRSVKSDYDINKATVQTFLTILSKYPDTLISRKYGEEKAKSVSKGAQAVLDNGGILTDGLELVERFDDKLVKNKLNPGTTADLTASSIMVALLDEFEIYNRVI
jgi:triphosphoribosyl-dephospho-CoA synthase